jgi:hypothetical protein
MTHVYEKVDGALYGHKTDLMECLRKIELDPDEIFAPRWDWKHGTPGDDKDVRCSNKLIWMYPQNRPPHDVAYYLRKISRDRYPNEAFTARLDIYTRNTSGTYRTYTAPGWLKERLKEYSKNNSVDHHAGRGQRASSRGYVVAIDVGKRRGIQDIRVERDIYIN